MDVNDFTLRGSMSASRRSILSDMYAGARSVQSVSMGKIDKNDLLPHEVADFIPEYITERFGKITPHSAMVKVKHFKGRRINSYNFELRWYQTEDSIESPGRWNKESVKMQSAQETNVEILGPTKETRHCDGPCGQLRRTLSLMQLGRCEHAICSNCSRKSKTTYYRDRNVRCSNSECCATLRELDDEQLPKLEKKKSESSRDEDQELREMMDVNVSVLERDNTGVMKRRKIISQEVPSTKKVIDALKDILGRRVDLRRARIFYMQGEDESRVKRLNLEMEGDKKIREFPLIDGALHFTVDVARQGNQF